MDLATRPLGLGIGARLEGDEPRPELGISPPEHNELQLDVAPHVVARDLEPLAQAGQRDLDGGQLVLETVALRPPLRLGSPGGYRLDSRWDR